MIFYEISLLVFVCIFACNTKGVHAVCLRPFKNYLKTFWSILNKIFPEVTFWLIFRKTIITLSISKNHIWPTSGGNRKFEIQNATVSGNESVGGSLSWYGSDGAPSDIRPVPAFMASNFKYGGWDSIWKISRIFWSYLRFFIT